MKVRATLMVLATPLILAVSFLTAKPAENQRCPANILAPLKHRIRKSKNGSKPF